MARPAAYNREEILELAMRAFWDKGYNATSMSDLVAITNLKPGSLYWAFRSKEDLLLAALDHYGKTSIRKVKSTLTDAGSPLNGIRDVFFMIAGEISDPCRNHGCFLVNSVLELSRQNRRVQKLVTSHLDVLESLFRETLESARAVGELPPQKNPASLASFLICSIWGLRVLSQTASSMQRTRMVVDQVLSVLHDH